MSGKEKFMNIDKYVIKKYEGLELKEIAGAPVYAISGVSEGDADLLREAFNVKTVSDLANLKYVKWAQAICTLAAGEL
jgi:hypothetical protein